MSFVILFAFLVSFLRIVVDEKKQMRGEWAETNQKCGSTNTHNLVVVRS